MGEEGCRVDYLRSETELEGEREGRVREVARLGLGRGFVGCEEGWVGVVCSWLEEEWGGVEAYLVGACGVRKEMVEGVRRILTVGEGEKVHL